MNSFLSSFKTTFFCILLLLIGGVASSQVTIVSDGLNGSSSLFNASGAFNYFNGISGNSQRPANSAYAIEGTNSFGSNDTSAALTSTVNINTSSYTGVSMIFRLAAFNVNSSAGGMELTDQVSVDVSADGGATYKPTVIVTGNTKAFWAYSATGRASTSYDGDGTAVIFTPAAGGSRTTDGYSTVEITNLPSVANLRFRITLTTSINDKRWLIDDFKVVGTRSITSTKTGLWSDPSTWIGGVVPTSANHVVIKNSHTVSTSAVVSRDLNTTTLVEAGGTLAVGGTYTNGGTTTINGTFQINAGGFGGGNGSFSYGTNGNLIFNHSNSNVYGDTGGINSNHKYWPSIDAPKNVTVNSNSPIRMDINRTVDGSLILNAQLDAVNTITVNGILQLNAFGYISSNAPSYGAASTLKYNIGGLFGRGFEWTSTSGPGYPNNVVLSGNTILNYPSTGTSAFSSPLGIAKNLSIESGSALYMSYGDGGNKSGKLTIGGNVSISGDLSLGNAPGGDLYIAGNWTRTGTGNGNKNGTFIPNNRAVFFNGTTAQTITGASTFDYLTINNTAGVTLANNIINNQTLDLTAGKLTLGTNNLTIGSGGSIVKATSGKYVVTNGTGRLIKNAVGTSPFTFPVGRNTTNYTPVTITNTAGNSNLSVNVVKTITNAVTQPLEVVNRQWNINSSAATTAIISPVWIAEDKGANFNTAGPGELGNFTPSAYSITPVTLGQTTTTATGVAIKTGDNAVVTGNTGAVYTAPPGNDVCSSAGVLSIDALAINGTLKGAKASSGLTYAPSSNDVWYKFTTATAGNHTISVNFTTGPDIDFDIFTSSCPGSGAGSFTADSQNATSEILTRTLAAETTYYIRVIDFSNTAGEFSIRVAGPPATLTVSESSLNFGNVITNTTSTSQSFTLTATSLSPTYNALTVTAPAYFEVSTDNGISWGSSKNVSYVATTTITNAEVLVRFIPTVFCLAATGNVTISGSNASTKNIAVGGTGIIAAATTTEASVITDTSFIANWIPVAGATGYELEVSSSPSFGITTSNPNLTIINNDGSSITTNGDWTYTGVTLSDSTDKYLKLINSTSSLISKTINFTDYSNINLSFKARTYGTKQDPKNNITLSVSVDDGLTWAVLATVIPVDNNLVFYNFGIDTYKYEKKFKVLFETKNADGGNGAGLDDIIIKGDKIVTDANFVSGFGPKEIVGQPTSSALVNNLEPNTKYYYRVRAINGSCKSINSNVIEALTKVGITTWNGSGWSNGLPTINKKAIIDGIYDMNSRPSITAYDLTVNNKLVVVAGNFVKITNELSGSATGDIIIESDGSFVQKENVVNGFVGKFTVKRNATMKRLDYTYWGSPVAGQMLKAFSPGTVNTRFLTYNSNDNLFSIVTDPTTTSFVAGKGYAIRASNYYPVWDPSSFPVTADKYKTFEGLFTGMPHNGNISIPLDSRGQGYNLVGNPYASNIDFNALAADVDIEGTAYFWTNINLNPVESSSAYTGENYASYNSTSGGVPATGQNLVDAPKRYIKVGQGFIVKAKSGGDQNLTFTNAMRNDGTDSSNFMNRGTAQADLVVDRFWLTLTTPAQNFNTILIAYPRGATNGYDTNADAQQMGQSSDSFYSQIEDKKLNIQGRQFPLINTDVVSLGMKGFEVGTYKIAMIAKDGVFANGQKIYLKDKQTNAIIDLSEESYTFVANEGLTEGRFEIVYQTGGVLQTGNVKRDELIVYKDGNGFVVKSTIQKISAVDVYDTSGRLVLTLNPNQMEITIDSSAMINGVYILKINRGAEVSRKKIIK